MCKVTWVARELAAHRCDAIKTQRYTINAASKHGNKKLVDFHNTSESWKLNYKTLRFKKICS